MSNVIDSRVVEIVFNNKNFESGVSKTISSLDRLHKALDMDKSTKSFGNLSDAVKVFSLGHISSDVSTLSDRFSNLGIIGLTVLQRLTNAAMNLAEKGLKKATSLFTNVFNQIKTGGMTRASNLEQADFLMSGIIKDEKEAQLIMQNANDAVLGTAYGLDVANKAAAQFAASGMKGGETMFKALRGVAGVAAMTNSSYEDIAQIFTTISGQGKIMTQQMRQLELRGLPVAQKLGEVMGVSEEKMREMIHKGEIDFEEFALAMDEAFGEHAQEANKTFSGALANMNAALSRMGAKFYSPHLEHFRDMFNAIRPAIDAFSAAVTPAINVLSKFEKVLTDRVIKAMSKFADENKNLTNLGKKIVYALASVIWVVRAVEHAIKNIGSTIGKAFTNAMKKLTGFSGVIRDVEGVLKQTFGEYLLRKIANFFIGIGKAIDNFNNTVDFDRVEKVLSNFIYSFSKAFKAIWGTVKELGSMIANIFKPIKDAFLEVFSFDDALGGIDIFTDMINGIKDALGKINDAIVDHQPIIEEAFVLLFDTINRTIQTTIDLFFALADVVVAVLGPLASGIVRAFGNKLAVQNIQDFGESLTFIFDKLEDTAEKIHAFADIIRGNSESIEKFGYGVGSTMRTVIEVVTWIFKGVVAAVGAIVVAIKTIVTWIRLVAKVVKKLATDFKNWVKVEVDIIKNSETFKKVLETLKVAFETIHKVASSFFDKMERTFPTVSLIVDLVKDKVEALKEKFKAFFQTFKDAESVGDWMHDMLAKIRGSEKLQEIFEKIRDFCSNAKTAIIDFSESSESAFSKFFKALGEFGRVLREFFSSLKESFKDYFGNMLEVYADKIQKGFEKVSDHLGSFGKAIKDLFENPKDFATICNNLIKLIQTIAAAGIGAGLVDIIRTMSEFVKTLTGVHVLPALGQDIKDFLDVIKDAINDFALNIKIDSLKKISKTILILAASLFVLALLDENELKQGIVAILVMVASMVGAMYALATILHGSKLSEMGSLSALLVGLATAIRILASAVKVMGSMEFGEVIQGLGAIALVLMMLFAFLDIAGDKMNKVAPKAAVSLILIAYALKTMAKAVQKFSNAEWGDMAKAGAALAAILGTVVLLDKFGVKVTEFIKFAIGIAKMAGALALIAKACQMFNKVKPKDLAKAGGVLLAFLVIAAMFQGDEIKNVGGKLGGMGTGMALIGAALLIIAKACQEFNKVKPSDLAKAGGVLMAFLFLVLIFQSDEINSGAVKMTGLALGMYLIAKALIVVAEACKAFNGVEWEDMAKAGASLAAFMAVVGLFNIKKLNSQASDMIGFAVGIAVVSAALKKVAETCGAFAGVNWGDMGKAGLALLVFLGLVALFNIPEFDAAAGKMIKFAIGMTLVGAALKMVAEVALIFAQLNPQQMITALVGIAGALAIMVTAMNAMKSSIAGALSMIIVAGALNLMAPALERLGNMPMENIGKALLAIAGSLAVFIGVGMIAGALVPVLLGLGVAMLTMTIAVGLLALDLIILGMALKQFNKMGFDELDKFVEKLKHLLDAMSEIGGAVTKFIGTMISAVLKAIKNKAGEIIDTVFEIASKALSKLQELLPQLILLVQTFLTGILQTIQIMIPQIQLIIMTFLSGLITTVTMLAPQFGLMVLTIIMTVLGVLEIAIPMIADAGMRIIEGFLLAIADRIDDVVTAAVDVIVAFLNGIGNNVQRVIDAAFDLILSFINGLTTSIEDHKEELKTSISDLITAALDLGKEVILGFLEPFLGAGKKLLGVNGLGGGIKSMKDKVVEKIRTVIKAAKKKVEDFVEHFKNAGKHLVQGIIDGIGELAEAVKEKARSIGSGILKALKGGLDEKSPSRTAHKYGVYLLQGLINGMDKKTADAERSVTTVSSVLLKALQNAADEASEAFNDISGDPVIRPVVDMTNIEESAKQMDALLSRERVQSILGDMDDEFPLASKMGSVVYNNSMTQNNYSPKELSRIDIYRDTSTLMARFERQVAGT